ncbi:MAG: Bro-N domain-containing protein [Phycisphaerae bacterium]|nr:Bro-N domain-containing protein [Phycisphaerae bacterium]
MTDKLVVFQGKQVRRVLHNNEWYFSVVDIIAALTDSDNPRDYWYRMKRREKESSGIELSTFCRQLKLTSSDGKSYKTDTVNTEAAFRIIQSIPSPKAEPFKRWLAKVGYERVQEIENPELASQRARALYKAKGYPDSWIEKRIRSIAIRDELTDEWKDRGIKEDAEFAILTADISKATFGLTPSEYKQLKGLKRQNLRDHMNDLELIFSMLGEAATTEITRKNDAQGFPENQIAAVEGGTIAGNARRQLEQKTGKPVVSGQNYLDLNPKKQIAVKAKNNLKDKEGK